MLEEKINFWKPIRAAGLYLALGCAVTGASGCAGGEWFPSGTTSYKLAKEPETSEERCERIHGYGNCDSLGRLTKRPGYHKVCK